MRNQMTGLKGKGCLCCPVRVDFHIGGRGSAKSGQGEGVQIYQKLVDIFYGQPQINKPLQRLRMDLEDSFSKDSLTSSGKRTYRPTWLFFYKIHRMQKPELIALVWKLKIPSKIFHYTFLQNKPKHFLFSDEHGDGVDTWIWLTIGQSIKSIRNRNLMKGTQFCQLIVFLLFQWNFHRLLWGITFRLQRTFNVAGLSNHRLNGLTSCDRCL